MSYDEPHIRNYLPKYIDAVIAKSTTIGTSFEAELYAHSLRMPRTDFSVTETYSPHFMPIGLCKKSAALLRFSAYFSVLPTAP